MPAAPFSYVHLLVFAFSIGLGAHLGRSFLRRQFPHENVKLITRVPYGIAGWTQLGLFYLAAASVYYHVSWATGYGTLVLARPYAHLALLEPYFDQLLDGLLIGLCIVLAGLIMPDSKEFDSPAAAFVTLEHGKAKQIATPARGTEEGFFKVFSQPSGFAVFVTDEHVQDRFLQMFSHEGEPVASIRLTS